MVIKTLLPNVTSQVTAMTRA